MKYSELKHLIKEELRKSLTESDNDTYERRASEAKAFANKLPGNISFFGYGFNELEPNLFKGEFRILDRGDFDQYKKTIEKKYIVDDKKSTAYPPEDDGDRRYYPTIKITGIKEKLNESKIETTVEKVADNPKLDKILSKLSSKQLETISNELKQLGITPETPNSKIVDKVEDIEGETIDESEIISYKKKSTKEKTASVLNNIGSGLIGSLLVPFIPLAIGPAIGGVAAGFAVTAGTAALLKGLAKALDKKVDSGGYNPTPG